MRLAPRWLIAMARPMVGDHRDEVRRVARAQRLEHQDVDHESDHAGEHEGEGERGPQRERQPRHRLQRGVRASMNTAPCDRLITPSTPNTSVKPSANSA
jgi:hypothetical protein